MGHIIASVNMKGGVGKTTLTINLAACLAKIHRQRVLIVDLDNQISATLSTMSPAAFAKLRRDRLTVRFLIEQILQPGKEGHSTRDTICDRICSVQGLDLLPGDIDIYDEYLVSEVLHARASTNKGADAGTGDNFQAAWQHLESTLVRKMLEPIAHNYDFILLDCAPGYNLLTRSSLVASDFYVVPARPEPLSLVGIQLLERRIARLRKAYEKDDSVNIRLLGLIFLLSGNSLFGRYYKQVMQRVAQDFNESQLFKIRIPYDVNIAKAGDAFTPSFLSAPNTASSKAFHLLTQEFLQKVKTSVGLKDQSSKMSLIDLD